MKPLFFLGASRKAITAFPVAAKRETGYQLDRVQQGAEPADWKPMPTVGSGVREIRLHVDGEHRVIYLATLGNAVYVLHAFAKKTRKTTKPDLDIAKSRYRQLMEAKQ